MTTQLVVGATGATGKHVVEQLLKSGQKVKIIVRFTSVIPDAWNSNNQLTIIKRNTTEITVEEMAEILVDCQAVVSCLGHNMTSKGIFGKPRKLVTDAVKLICEAIIKNASETPVKIVLMNTAGNSNRVINEPVSPGQTIIVGLIRVLIPPHADNEKAADYLSKEIGQNHEHIAWVVIRPDTLINEEKVTKYSLHKSPIRSAIFNPGKTSRINVGHFMTRLLLDDHLWNTWKGQMPVLYNEDN